MNTDVLLDKLHAIDRECRYLEQVSSVLQWDQETYLPKSGVNERSEQLALLGRLSHERFTSSETGLLLEELGSVSDNPLGDEKLPPLQRDFLKIMRRDYDRQKKLPSDFVTDAARAEGLSTASWAQARKKNDFASFLPHLETMIDLARKRAVYWGYENREYDGLLSIYEPGMDTESIKQVFGTLKQKLISLLKKIREKQQPDCSFLDQNFDISAQGLFCRELMKRLGFDQDRGRLDISAHPFTTTLGSDDILITTKLMPLNLLSGIFSVIHECGHAFYEMSFPQ